MPGEMNLQKLTRSMQLILNEGEYVFTSHLVYNYCNISLRF
ncbi:ACT domain-containing protein [Chitinophaga sp. 30R24]